MREWQLTYSGRKVYPRKPDREVVDINDVAHHLAMENRYCGATHWPYSVAQHSVYVSYHVPNPYKLEGLLHDSGEYVMRDLPKPVKDSIDTEEHTRLEREWTRAVMLKFGIVPSKASHDIIKRVDQRIVLDETAALSPCPEVYPPEYPGIEPLGIKIERWAWEDAKYRFLNRFEQLLRERVWYL